MAHAHAGRVRKPTLRPIGVLACAMALLIAPSLLRGEARAQSIDYLLTPGKSAGWGRAPASPLHAIPEQEVSIPSSALPDRLRRAVVMLNTREAPGTVIIDTGNTTLYFVLGQGRAIRYGVGVGREGFTWSGTQTISHKAEWPDWHPPAEMVARQPYLPRFMAGGPGSPLGARAIYLGNSLYRIHGTNDPSTIGKFVSSGCIRLTNEDVIDLFNRVNVGTKVVVLPKKSPRLQAQVSLSVRPPAGERPVVMQLPSGQRSIVLSASALY